LVWHIFTFTAYTVASANFATVLVYVVNMAEAYLYCY